MKNKITAILFIVVFLLVVAVVFTFFSSFNKDAGAPDVSIIPTTEPSDADITYTPEPSQSIYSPAPTQPANTPVPTPPPTPTPTPAPEPSVEPESTQTVSYGAELGSGSFRSDTGAKLDIHADWSARSVSSSQAEITVKIILDSYSLHIQAVPNSVNINLGGQYVSLSAPAVDYDGSAALSTELASKTFTVDLAEGQADSFSLAVEWHFGGTYGDVELPVIECGGTIGLSR